jgi:hypothetical protein
MWGPCGGSKDGLESGPLRQLTFGRLPFRNRLPHLIDDVGCYHCLFLHDCLFSRSFNEDCVDCYVPVSASYAVARVLLDVLRHRHVAFTKSQTTELALDNDIVFVYNIV